MQPIQSFLRDYDVCTSKSGLSPKMKSSFFNIIFTGPARKYFLDHRITDMSYREQFEVMLKEYDHDARQLEAQSELECLTLTKIMKETDATNVSVGLDRLVTRINTLTQQCLSLCRSDNHKICTLRSALLQQDRAIPAISQITTSKSSFNHFVTALRENLQFSPEKNGNSPTEDRAGSARIPQQLLYQRYGRPLPPKYRRLPMKKNKNVQSRSGQKTHRKNTLDCNGKRMLCHTCGFDEHLSSFHRTNDIQQFVRDNLADRTPSVHIVHDLMTTIGKTSENVSAQQESMMMEEGTDDLNHSFTEDAELNEFERLVDQTYAEPDSEITCAFE